MNPNPLVSIITPVYNHEKFIGDTINSIINQTYQNWEMLIVDDCSTDESWEIMQEWAKKDNRIKIFKNEENKGLIPNWKFLIDNSKGEYIAFLEGDDIFCPENLKKKMEIFEKYSDLGMVYNDFDVIDEENNVLIKNFYKKLSTKTYQKEKIKASEYLYSKNTPFSTYGQIMIRKNVISISGYPRSFSTNEKIFLPSDWDFNFRVATKNKIYFIEDVLLQYRKHAHNNSKVTPKVSLHLSLILDNYEKEFAGNLIVQRAIKYMRGKTIYFKIIFYLENGMKKEACKEFLYYIRNYPNNFFRDFKMNCLMIFRILMPNKFNEMLKEIYFGGYKAYGKKLGKRFDCYIQR